MWKAIRNHCIGKPYHFKEIKDWANMSDQGNLAAILDYID
jgi:hypothetical protein